MIVGGEDPEFGRQFSKLGKLVRITAWILRFYKNSREELKRSGPLSLMEHKEAMELLTKQSKQNCQDSAVD